MTANSKIRHFRYVHFFYKSCDVITVGSGLPSSHEADAAFALLAVVVRDAVSLQRPVAWSGHALKRPEIEYDDYVTLLLQELGMRWQEPCN